MSRILERRTFWLLGCFAIAARLALIATTYGSNDAGFMAVWVDLLKHTGIARSYSHNAMMNHPPLSAAYLRFIEGLATSIGIAFVDVFRFFQVIADVIAATALFHIGKHTSVERGRALALFLLLSPGAAFISAFHCNTDATMVALICVAAAFLATRPALAGGFLALASGIKIIPFLVAPIFAMPAPHPPSAPSPRKRGEGHTMMFVVGFAIVAFAIFVPTIVIGGPIVAKVLFGYRGGLPYEWGIPGVAFALSRIEPSFKIVMTFWQKFGSWFEYAAVLAVLALVWKHKPRTTDETLHATEIMLLTVLALAPGFGVQYTGWLIAFLPFAFAWRGAIVMNAAISTFLFVTYTVWSGGWPWFFADIARPGRYRWVAAIAGYVMWAIVCAALVIAIRRFTAARRSETAG